VPFDYYETARAHQRPSTFNFPVFPNNDDTLDHTWAIEPLSQGF